MNLKQALYIQTIAKTGSITAAAQKLYVSQPSLSQMLRQVEDELGLPLFNRSRAPLRPTYAGECYLRAAAAMLNADAILRNELQQILSKNSGRLRLGISMQRSARILPSVLPKFFGLYPKVSLELREAGSAMLERMVCDGDVDLALASTEAGNPALKYELLQRETVGILAGLNSPLAASLPSGASIPLEQIGDGPFISLKVGHNLRVIQDFLFQQKSLRPAIRLESDSLETALRVTQASSCYMLCTDSYTTSASYFYPLLEYTNHRHYCACYRRDLALPKYMQDFIRLVLDCLQASAAQQKLVPFPKNY